MSQFLSLKGIHFIYPESARPVFEEMQFDLGRDDRVGLIGPNGCGKSTFLQICIGLLKPDRGSLLFKGDPVKSEADLARLRRHVGFVFQNPDDQLFSPTVLEDVAFGPLNLGLKPDAARQRARQALQLVGLENFEDRITHKLSGGEKRLLSLATILAMQPDALLLDEPSTGLDPQTREHIMAVLNKLQLTLVIVSHDWDFVAQTTSKFHSIRNGRIIELDKGALHQHVHYHPSGDVPHEHRNLGLIEGHPK